MCLRNCPPIRKNEASLRRRLGIVLKRLAYQGKLLGIPATVVMPKHAPLIKVTTCQKLGARVVLHGKDFAEAKTRAHEIGEKEKLAYIDGYDDPSIIAGQGQWAWKSWSRFPTSMP